MVVVLRYNKNTLEIDHDNSHYIPSGLDRPIADLIRQGHDARMKLLDTASSVDAELARDLGEFSFDDDSAHATRKLPVPMVIDPKTHKLVPAQYDLGSIVPDRGNDPAHLENDLFHAWTGDHTQEITFDALGNIVEHHGVNLSKVIPKNIRVDGKPLPDGVRVIPANVLNYVDANGKQHNLLFAGLAYCPQGPNDPYRGWNSDNGLKDNRFISRDTYVFDVSDPAIYDKNHPKAARYVAKISGIEQLSATYDPGKKQLVFSGNKLERGDANTRSVWTVDTNQHPLTDLEQHPSQYFSDLEHNWHRQASWLKENRENQIISMGDKGIIQLSADDSGTLHARYAHDAEGLAEAKDHPLIHQFDSRQENVDPHNVPCPTGHAGEHVIADHRTLGRTYGPEVVSIVELPDHGFRVTYNVSQWINNTNNIDQDTYRVFQYTVDID